MTGKNHTRTHATVVTTRARAATHDLGRILASALGVGFLVIGVVALVRSGIRSDLVLTAPHVSVGWLHHTPLLAIIHLVVGASLIPAGWYSWLGDRATPVGLFALIAGLVFWIEPDAFHGALGIHRAHAVTYLAAAVLLMLAGWLTSPERLRS